MLISVVGRGVVVGSALGFSGPLAAKTPELRISGMAILTTIRKPITAMATDRTPTAVQ
jgi:hypothetical protein